MKTIKYLHPYHVVTNSPWPFYISLNSFFLTTSCVLYFHNYISFTLVFYAIYLLILTMSLWWRDIIREGTFEGQHTLKVQKSLRIGILFFIFSEIMFFFGFFWAFFHSSLVPTLEIGGIWPPKYIYIVSPWGLPLLNTLLLLTSGISVTISHHALRLGLKDTSFDFLYFTIILAILFTFCQIGEYIINPTTISDGIYGSIFYMLTGFHGFHVIIGTIFLFVNFIRIELHHFTKTHHIGFEGAIWYWHFVDIVWIFLYLFLYIWGGK